jgi:16S rRNA (guanine527-N7)-methyltransferase
MSDPMTDAQCRRALGEGGATLGLTLSEHDIDRLLIYLRELLHWNRAYNLVATATARDMVTIHLLDSLSIGAHLQGARVADVGSGAGLPGIPLALVYPGRAFTLVESRRKRVTFLRHIQRRLNLENVRIVHTRVEDYREGAGAFDSVLSRAFARLEDMLALCGRLCAPGGHLLAMKGRAPKQEIRALPVGLSVQAVHRLHVPGLTAERHLVILSPRTETD